MAVKEALDTARQTKTPIQLGALAIALVFAVILFVETESFVFAVFLFCGMLLPVIVATAWISIFQKKERLAIAGLAVFALISLACLGTSIYLVTKDERPSFSVINDACLPIRDVLSSFTDRGEVSVSYPTIDGTFSSASGLADAGDLRILIPSNDPVRSQEIGNLLQQIGLRMGPCVEVAPLEGEKRYQFSVVGRLVSEDGCHSCVPDS